jgi:serine/threonine-protein kinase
MDADRNLLFGVLALQAELLDANQFIQACTLWTTRKETSLADLLLELGWITSTDKGDVERLTRRKLHKHGSNVKAGLATLPDDIKRSLAALEDRDIDHSLAGLPPPDAPFLAATVDYVPQPRQRYVLSRLHATGGVGRVWLALDSELGREVALKELRPERAGDTALWARFLREAQITGQLEHPGIVPVYELAKRPDTHQPFYTMRFVKGRTLRETARAHHQKRATGQADPLDLLALLNAFVTVCNTVAYAHSRGVIHRDLKGQNVVLGDFGEVVVLDWGLAKHIALVEREERSAAITLDEEQSSDASLTVQGQALGTPAYMAPEQAAGRVDLIGPCTDVYGLGAILYEILTGQAPFTGADMKEVLRKVREEEPVRPCTVNADVPSALETACLRALAKTPAERHASATDLAQEVQRWQEVQRRQAEEERDRFFTLSLDMLCIAGFDDRFRRLNPAFERTLGFTIEQLMAEPFFSFVHPEDRAVTLTEMQKLATGAETIVFENRYRCRDGSYKWLLWTATPFLSQQLIYAAARDITERKRTEAALRESEELYRSVIASLQEGIVLVDGNGSIQACNASAEQILGLSADQLMGLRAVDPRWRAIHEDGSPFPGEAFPVMVTLRSGKPCSNVVMGVYKPSGELTWIAINSRPLTRPDEAVPYAVVASFEDITVRKQIEERLRQMAEELASCKGQRLPAEGSLPDKGAARGPK